MSTILRKISSSLKLFFQDRKLGFSFKLVSKWPSRSQWKGFFNVLNNREKILFFSFLVLSLGSAIFLGFSFYYSNTESQPAEGGKYIEGVVGQPHFLNPALAAANDVDRDLVELIFSGLMKYNSAGEVIPDLAKEYKVLDEGRVYEFYLKENVFWHDGAPLLADDVVFTIKTIQNSDYKSPVQANWLGIDVEKISDYGVRFTLKKPYSAFIENTTQKILPKHIFNEVSPENFPFLVYNLKPVGSGPFKFKNLTQEKNGNIKALNLVRNLSYFGKTPFIKEFSFYFFETEKELVKSAEAGKVNGFALIWPNKNNLVRNKNFLSYEILLPRYFAVFFNPSNSKVLAEKEVRQALNFGTNKQDIINKALSEQGRTVDSPLLPDVFGFDDPTVIYEFNPEKAKELLEIAGFKIMDLNTCLTENESEEKCKAGLRQKVIEKKNAFKFTSNLKTGSQGDEVKELQKCLAKDPDVYPEQEISGYFGETTKKAVIKFQEKYSKEILEPSGLTKGTGEVKTATRAKLNELCAESPIEKMLLKFSLVVPNQSSLVEVANVLEKQWQVLGVDLEIKIIPTSEIASDFIKPRDYDSLLFGEVLGSLPDPFPFWHSFQKKDPGLNLASYENKKADALLEDLLEIQDPKERKKKYEELQNILIQDAPAVFLYRPNYVYLASNYVKGLNNIQRITEPAKRFSEIENWYITTKRVWK